MPRAVARPLLQTLFSGYVSEGPRAKEFEAGFQQWVGNPNTALVNSGTSALTLALRLAGVGPGDEVVSTPMTCLASNEPIAGAGAKPVWSDVEPDTGNVSPDSVAEHITERTKAIMAVDWAGMPIDLDRINHIASQHGIPVIEDAAHALGATYRGKKIGSHSSLVCFSFQAIKHLTTVDGGAVACNRPEVYARAKLLRWFGLSRERRRSTVDWEGEVTEPGYKMHMNDVNATLGLVQLKYVDRIVRKHKENATFLRKALRNVPNLELLRVARHAQPSYWIFTLKLPDAKARVAFSEALLGRGVENGVAHLRNDGYALFQSSRKEALPGLDDFSSRMLNIPCGWWLTEKQRAYVADAVEKTARAL